MSPFIFDPNAPMNRNTKLTHRRLPVVCLLALLMLSGCDTTDTGSNTIVLFANVSSGDIEALTFRFDPQTTQTGQFVDLVSVNRLDVADFLFENGFSQAEIVSATVEAAELEIVFPIPEVASFMDEAILKLDAQGISAIEVAEQTVFPNDDDEVDLNVRSRDIAGVLRAADFGGILQVNANAFLPNVTNDYELFVSLQLRIEVEGF
jgi:hypothetical protein